MRWVDDEPLDRKAFRDTGQKQWWSSWLPGIFDEELPVYERQTAPPKPKPRGEPTTSTQAPPLTSEQWVDHVKTTLRDWVNERGGLARTVNAPQDYEFIARDRDASELWGHCATCYYADAPPPPPPEPVVPMNARRRLALIPGS
ncbi:hypothetical protein [Sorangium sp. So ce362]|uniref:hypothetical protein n=1 Tax=Sorangium sp. So ce362 TaxID=3133303 RepID=UPI003F5E72F5